MPLIYPVELQRDVNIVKEMTLLLVLFDLGLRGICFIFLVHTFMFISSDAISLAIYNFLQVLCILTNILNRFS